MPGTAFDGSIWVTGFQTVGVAAAGALGAVGAGLLLSRMEDEIDDIPVIKDASAQTRRRSMKPPPQKSVSEEPSKSVKDTPEK
ncbi:hypothetical protein CYMTET_46929 [Cymbomonas tetramitiformis]|uniref:Uncharacterized protein n=1 Tax=Cymbomonas tetramitiformis TaxID=36881 RepID=A0AAE0EY81_9CHLO|nr:hypothetical protein CYMTET_46929 [Cymbomonas tetramitiformis]